MTAALLAGGFALAIMAFVAHNPTLRTIQQRIISLRAAWMLAPRMWQAAQECARRDYAEMRRRAKDDV